MCTHTFVQRYMSQQIKSESLLSTNGLSVYMLTDMDIRDFKSESRHTHTYMLSLSPSLSSLIL